MIRTLALAMLLSTPALAGPDDVAPAPTTKPSAPTATTGNRGATAPVDAAPTEGAVKADANPQAEILGALELPKAAQDLRNEGVSEDEVKDALGKAKDKGLSAGETRGMVEETTRAVKEHGPVDNFGAFVQQRLDEGLRGQDLAAAIRAEHEARGKGKGHGKSGEHGKPDDAGKSGEHGKPDAPGKSGEHGKPDGAGKGKGTGGGNADGTGGGSQGGKADDAGAGKKPEVGAGNRGGTAGEAKKPEAAGGNRAGTTGGKPATTTTTPTGGKPETAGKPAGGGRSATTGGGK